MNLNIIKTNEKSNTNNEIRMSHRTIAEHLGLRPDNIKNTIAGKIALFERFGPIPIEKGLVTTGLGIKQSVDSYYLNSNQANLLLTFTRSNKITDEAKVNLIESYEKAKKGQLLTNRPVLSLEQQVAVDFELKVRNAKALAELLGFSEGHTRKEALEMGVEVERDTGVRVLPNFLLNDPSAQTPQELDEHTGTHAAIVNQGGEYQTPSIIASNYPKEITSTVVNEILVRKRYCRKLAARKYLVLTKGELFADTTELASGPHKGKVIVAGWTYDSSRAFKKMVDEAVATIMASKDKPKIALTRLK